MEDDEDSLFHCVESSSHGVVPGFHAPVVLGFHAPVVHGFYAAKHYWAVAKKADGSSEFSASASLLASPIDDGGPVVWWEVRYFYYALGFSPLGDDLSSWLRRKSNMDRLHQLFDSFGVDPALHFRASKKQILAKMPDMTADELVWHDVEAMGSSAYIVAFLLCMHGSSLSVVSTSAKRILTSLCNVCSAVSCNTLEHLCGDLPRCHTTNADNSMCSHCKLLVARVAKAYGDTWPETRAVELLIESRRSVFQSKCAVIDEWISHVLVCIVDAIDAHVQNGALQNSALGLPLCRGVSKLRRMTKHWLTSPGLGVDRSASSAVLVKKTARDKSSLHAEGLQLGRCTAWLGSAVSGAKQIAVSMDASDCSREIMSFAAAMPNAHEPDKTITGWMPVKVRYRSDFNAQTCFDNRICTCNNMFVALQLLEICTPKT
jgi:hypothetical protein